MTKIEISTIFKTSGQPTITYVRRDEGAFEKSLLAALMSKGRLCLLTGPSKTGKTTLYHRVLQDMRSVPLIVRCDNQLANEEFWTRALEGIDFERINSKSKSGSTEISGVGKISGKFGWAWLAEIIGEVSLGIKRTMSESEIRERILSKPSPQHLIPALKNLPVTLVIEDFHYLSETVQTTIFQQWKAFIDNEVSVLVVGTTHHAVDLARANKDLLGRISQIEMSSWTTNDLARIAEQGFDYLQLQLPNNIKTELAREVVGLPIIMQDVCRQLFVDKGLIHVDQGVPIGFTKEDAYLALHHIAISNYAQLEAMYERLKTGPRKKARKYETYEYILAAFTQDPPTFSLRRHEIDDRLEKMNIPSERRPPSQSINSTLKALSKFQTSIGLELLEWIEKDQKLFIVEPTFLFYLRWRIKRSKPPTISEIIETILSSLSIWGSSLATLKGAGKPT